MRPLIARRRTADPFTNELRDNVPTVLLYRRSQFRALHVDDGLLVTTDAEIQHEFRCSVMFSVGRIAEHPGRAPEGGHFRHSREAVSGGI